MSVYDVCANFKGGGREKLKGYNCRYSAEGLIRVSRPY